MLTGFILFPNAHPNAFPKSVPKGMFWYSISFTVKTL